MTGSSPPATSAQDYEFAELWNPTADQVQLDGVKFTFGIDFAAVAWGYSAPEALRALRPDRFFASVAEIATALA